MARIILSLMLTFSLTKFAKSDEAPITKKDTNNISVQEGPSGQRQIGEIINKIRVELNNPSSNLRRPSSLLNESQAIIRNQIFQLADLASSNGDYIYGLIGNDSSKAATALLISLGLNSDSRAHEKLREIVRGEKDPNIRAIAVRALSTYRDITDLPLFALAISDTNVVIVEGDILFSDGQFSRPVNMVGIEAAGAMAKMGYTFAADSINGGYKAVKIK